MYTKTLKNKVRLPNEDGYAPTLYSFDYLVTDPDAEGPPYRLYERAERLLEKRAYNIAFGGKTFLEHAEREIKHSIKITKNEIFKIGELLAHAKEVCQQEGMGFQQWIEDRFDFSYETALNFMNVWKYCFAQRELTMGVKSSLLYRLSTPSFSDDLREYLLESGALKKMTGKRLSKILEKYKEGGIEAIEGEIKALSEINYSATQVNYAFDLAESALRTMDNLTSKIARWHPEVSNGNEGYADEINEVMLYLYESVKECSKRLEQRVKKAVMMLQKHQDSLWEKHGVTPDNPDEYFKDLDKDD